MVDLTFNTLGIMGVVLILLAYFMLQTDKLAYDHILYPSLNLFGSILLLISLMWNWNLPSVIIEVCWMVISIYGIYAILTGKHKKKEDKNG